MSKDLRKTNNTSALQNNGLQGRDRAKYGAAIIKEMSRRLAASYGKGYTKSNLYGFVQFYKMFPHIFHSVSGKFNTLLSWTHNRTLVQSLNESARKWCEKEAAEQGWSVRTLQRNIFPQHYFRSDAPAIIKF